MKLIMENWRKYLKEFLDPVENPETAPQLSQTIGSANSLDKPIGAAIEMLWADERTVHELLNIAGMIADASGQYTGTDFETGRLNPSSYSRFKDAAKRFKDSEGISLERLDLAAETILWGLANIPVIGALPASVAKGSTTTARGLNLSKIKNLKKGLSKGGEKGKQLASELKTQINSLSTNVKIGTQMGFEKFFRQASLASKQAPAAKMENITIRLPEDSMLRRGIEVERDLGTRRTTNIARKSKIQYSKSMERNATARPSHLGEYTFEHMPEVTRRVFWRGTGVADKNVGVKDLRPDLARPGRINRGNKKILPGEGFDVPYGFYGAESRKTASNYLEPGGKLKVITLKPAAKVYKWSPPAGESTRGRTGGGWTTRISKKDTEILRQNGVDVLYRPGDEIVVINKNALENIQDYSLTSRFIEKFKRLFLR